MGWYKAGRLELEAAAERGESAGRGLVGCGVFGGEERHSEPRRRVSLGKLGELGA